MKIDSPERLRLGPLEVNIKTGEIRPANCPEATKGTFLQEKSLRVLRMLMEKQGELVLREEIQKALWPNDTVVDFDHGIHVAVATLRRALGDSATSPQFIETVPRRGYRLLVPIEEAAPGWPPEPVPGLGDDRSHDQNVGSGLAGKFVSHFRVLAILGAGGMGTVYEAEDTKLGRRVALKVLPEEMADDPAALRRFEREARTTSSLNHHNICTIFAVEEFERQPVIVMELLEGETLRDRLARVTKEPVSLVELLDIALQTCDGLAAAHSRGIIHRDIKPANLFLITSDQSAKRWVKILDFGLAKLMLAEPSNDVWGLNATASGVKLNEPPLAESDISTFRAGGAAGTASYMSPEQIRREVLDARTDLFSFGLVLYEMATGQRAFPGDDPAKVREALLHEEPVPVRQLNPSIPAALETVIGTALEKDRGQRHQSATALKNDLERIVRDANPVRKRVRRAIAAVTLLALVAVGIWRYEVHRHRITLSPTDTIVLADADNQTGDPVFDDALNIALRYEMQQTPYLNILGIDKAYATLAQLKLSSTTKITPDVARQICAKTNSKMVISQSIADAGNGYHLEMRALDCGSGAIVGKEQADIGSRNEVIHELGATALHLRARLGEPSASLARFNQPLEKALSASLEALQAGAEGTKLHYAGDVAGALKLYQRTIELDPNLALTYEGMGAAYKFLGNTKLSEASYTRAYQLRDRLTEKDRLNAEINYYGDGIGDWEKNYSSVLRFLQLFPRDVFGHHNLVAAFLHLGQPDRAADEAAEAARLQPGSFNFGTAIECSRIAGRFIEAKSWLAKADALKFDNQLIREQRLMVLFAAGDRDDLAKVLAEEERGSDRRDALLMHALIETQQGRFLSAERLRLQAFGIPLESTDIPFWVIRSVLENAEAERDMQARRFESKADRSKLDRADKLWLALALARSGRTEEAGKLTDQISAERPEDTLVQNYFAPTIRAAIKLQQHDPAAAIDLLRGTAKYDLAFTESFDYVYPAYIRGLAYLELGDGRAAAAQFQKLIDNPGLTLRHVIGPLAWLQLGRAQKMMGDQAAARKSYEAFLDLWKNADPDIPIYQQAKAEYAKLSRN
jgi:serine/threonine protein kinase/DNA-binding winged helix-turn-helix (wHTH) protein/tetratricopeptide (TPR) repeat protein